MAVSTKFYTSWFCPFAQRAWIALLHKNVEFEYIEQIPYLKSEEWLSISPRGLVPCIVDEGKSIYESTVCIEYVDERWTEGPSLLPTDPYSRAQVRIWSDHITKKIVPPFYAMLMKRTDCERKEAQTSVLSAIRAFQESMSDSGPYFMGSNFGMVDIMMFPFAQRMSKQNVLHHFREFYIPEHEEFARYQKWYTAVKSEPSIQKTIFPKEKLYQIYQRYADDTAQTEVADAIRKGKVLP